MPIWVITGCSRGLGLEYVTQLSTNPSNIVIATIRSTNSAHDALTSLQSTNKNIHILPCDTSSTSSITEFASQVSTLLARSTDGDKGDAASPKIDFLINNAGINSVPQEDALSLTESGLQAQIQTNVLGPASMTRVLLPHLGRGSVVVNISSNMGSISERMLRQHAESTTYCISKAALNMLTVHQSVQLRDKGVVVLAVDPGWVKTDMGGEAAGLEKETSVGGVLAVLAEVDGVDGWTGRFLGWDGKGRQW